MQTGNIITCVACISHINLLRMVVVNESELLCSTSIFERSKRWVFLHIVRYLLEITKRFRDIISRVLHHQHLNEDMENIKFRDQFVLEEIV